MTAPQVALFPSDNTKYKHAVSLPASPSSTTPNSPINPTTPEPHHLARYDVDPDIIAALNKFNDPLDEFPNPYDDLPPIYPFPAQGQNHSAPDLGVGESMAPQHPQRLPSVLRPAHPQSFDSIGSRRASLALGSLDFTPSPFSFEDGRIGLHSPAFDGASAQQKMRHSTWYPERSLLAVTHEDGDTRDPELDHRIEISGRMEEFEESEEKPHETPPETPQKTPGFGVPSGNLKKGRRWQFWSTKGQKKKSSKA